MFCIDPCKLCQLFKVLCTSNAFNKNISFCVVGIVMCTEKNYYVVLRNIQCSHTMFSVWHQCMSVYDQTLAYADIRQEYARHTLGVRQAYVVYVPNTLTYVSVRCYTQGLNYFLDMFKLFQRMRSLFSMPDIR